jgi:hypothetical protein
MRRILAYGLVILLAIGGCSSGANPNLPTNTFENDEVGVFTDDSGDTMQFGPGTVLPDDWPAALPIPSGELLSVSVRQDGGAVATWIVADDTAQATLDAYLIALQEAGFSAPVQSTLSVPDDGIFTYDMQSDDFDATVSAVIVPDESEITLIASPRGIDG